MNNHAKNKGRMAIYTMAGFYLLYLAYSMLRDLNASSGNERTLMIVFLIFFVVVGAGMMIMGIVTGYKLSRKDIGADTSETEEMPEEMACIEANDESRDKKESEES